MSTAASWLPVMATLIHTLGPSSTPTLLAYDRYGQGLTSDTDPADIGKPPGRGHTCADAASDLHELVKAVWITNNNSGGSTPDPRIILVANSIGCAIARLYAALYPIAGILLLDSILANSDFDFYPDPDASGFDAARDLPEDISVEALRGERKKLKAIFDPALVNAEGLDRSTLREVLPDSDKPILGREGERPWVTVVGHGFETFAEQSFKV